MAKKREWSRLPPEIARSIAELLPAIELPRFRSVCRSWSSATEGLTPSAPVSPFPWLCLVSSGDQTLPSFFSRPENRYRHFCLSPDAAARLVGGRDGWMVYLFNDDLPVLINPLTRARRYLPSLASFCAARGGARVLKIVLSAAPSSPAASVLAVSLFDDRRRLAFSRMGDDAWTPLYPLTRSEYKSVAPDAPVRLTELIQDVLYHDRSFFALLRSGRRMLAFDISAGPAASLLTYKCSVPVLNGFVPSNKGLLLCSAPCGDLLHVRWKKCAVSAMLTNIAVMKLNSEMDRWTEVEDLCGGDGSLFLGCDQAVMLCNVPELKSNCVYFTDDYCNPRAASQVVRVYDLEKGTVEPFFSPWRIGGPDDVLTWFMPSLS